MSQIETGHCLCGSLRCEFDRSAVISAHHCHCEDCRRSTGSGKATIILMPAAAVTVEGEWRTYTVKGSDGSHIARGFCPTCGTPMLSYMEEAPDLRFVKAGTLTDSSWVSISSSFWSDSAQAWSPVDCSLTAFAKNPPMDAFG